MLARQATEPKPTGDEWELIRIDLLTEKECAEVLSVVHDLIGYKSGTRLGAASYKPLPLIGKQIDKYPIGKQINKYIYRRRAMKLNPIFRERLGWLYDRLAKALADALGAPTRYPDDLALPGFHVNQKAIREKTVGPFRTGPAPHFDLQWQKIDWGDPSKVDFKLPLSFTLAVALPAKGGGLKTWDIRYDEYRKLDTDEKAKLRAVRKEEYHPYTVGQMVLHSGFQLHQVAPTPDFGPGDERITLQGHGIKRDGVWQLYW